MRKLTKTEIDVIKSTAKSIQPFIVKRQKFEQEIKKIEAEAAANESQIEVFESFIRNMTGGFGSQDLITVQKKQTGERDGKPIYVNEYIFHEPIEEDNTPLEDLLN